MRLFYPLPLFLLSSTCPYAASFHVSMTFLVDGSMLLSNTSAVLIPNSTERLYHYPLLQLLYDPSPPSFWFSSDVNNCWTPQRLTIH